MKKPVIVCVDDEPAVLDSLKIELKRALGDECIIETAEGGSDALELMRELQEEHTEIALVLSDYIMPDIKGDELLGHIHQLSPQTLTIMLTGQADLTAVGNAIKSAKLYRYIPKPWHSEDLKITVLEAVHSYLQERKLAEQTIHLRQLNIELQEANQQLLDSKSRLSQFLEAVPLGFSVFNPDGTMLYLNNNGKELLGVNEATEYNVNVIQQKNNFFRAGTMEPYPQKELPIIQALQGKAVISDDLEVQIGDQRFPIEIQAKPIFDEQNTLLYAVSSFQDISERRQKEAAMREATRSDEANRAKSAFLANMSHELRTPLNAILGFARILLSRTTITGEERQNLKIINRSGEHLLNLINQVLDLSKVEAGRMVLELGTCNLHQLLIELREMFQLRAKERGLQLKFQRSSHIPIYIEADEMKLRQILINLLSNAIKFTSQGQVCLMVETLNPELLEFTVTDTGVGIATEELNKIFQAFVQASFGRRAQEGTGLGLAISQEFAQLMGGKIEVSSEVGKGSTFKFSLPIKVLQGEEQFNRSEQSIIPLFRRIIGLAPGQPSYKILVVDDQESNRQLLSQILQPLGFVVRQAVNGQEAIDLWQSWQPALICMDLKMLLMDGYIAVREIRSRQATGISDLQNTIIVAFTATATPNQREFAIEQGFDDFISKPFHQNQVLEVVGKHLGVEYVYDNEVGDDIQDIFAEEATAKYRGFTWADKIKQAIKTQDWEEMEHCISEICQEDLDFAYALQCHLDNCDYDQMMQLVEENLAIGKVPEDDQVIEDSN
jgi:PAS domain S-box-containing protein